MIRLIIRHVSAVSAVTYAILKVPGVIKTT